MQNGNQIIVTRGYRDTGIDCHMCEDGQFVRDGHELFCNECHYTPEHTGGTSITTEWERHEKQVEARASGELDGRPRLVGGYEDAYWGEGSYSFKPGDGFSL